jgi:hypothetical protein
MCLYATLESRPGADINLSLSSGVLVITIPAIYAYLASRLTRSIGFSALVIGVGWMAVELAFSLLGVRGGLVGATGAGISIFQWVGRTLGCVFVAFLIAFLSASLVSLLSTVRLSFPQSWHWLRLRPRQTVPANHTCLCFPIWVLNPLQPRAPPWPCLTTRTTAAG